jgi:hypothetical protein
MAVPPLVLAVDVAVLAGHTAASGLAWLEALPDEVDRTAGRQPTR